jgi:hypothetical protein
LFFIVIAAEPVAVRRAFRAAFCGAFTRSYASRALLIHCYKQWNGALETARFFAASGEGRAAQSGRKSANGTKS